MRRILRNYVLCFIGLLLFALFAKAQDESPSLGDVARKTRQQKQETKDTQDKTKASVKTPRVITDEQVAHSMPDSSTATTKEDESTANAAAGEPSPKLPAEQWKSRILAQKNAVNTLQSNIEKENESIQFAPANCVSGCVQWNEQQKKKQADVERMQAELKEQQKRLDEMQESARQQGYGSSVSDPE
jgi:LAS superfamily LD-carboxypeptidase LdcB